MLVISLICGALGFLIHLQFPTIGPRGTIVVRALLVIAMLVNGALAWKMVRTRISAWVGLTSILTTGLALRLHMLALARQTMLFPDAISYRVQAINRDLFTFWDGNTWTPFWAYCLRVWYRIFGTNEVVQRSLTLILSLAVVVTIFWLGRVLFSSRTGLAASMLVALSPLLIWNSVQGLREEVGILELLALLLFLKTQKPTRRTAIFVGLTVGLIGLTRTEFLPVAIVLVALTWIRRDKLLSAGTALAVSVVLIFPQGWAIWAQWGQPDFWVKNFTRGWVNMEYQSGNLTEAQFQRSGGGQPLPDKERLTKSIFAGPLLGPQEWFFKVHTPRETFTRTLTGAALLPFYSFRAAIWLGQDGSFLTDAPIRDREPFVTATWIGGVTALLGLIALALRGHWQILLTMLMLGVIYAMPFTIGDLRYNQDPPLFDMRLSEAMVPLLALGLGSIIGLVKSRRSDHSTAIQSPTSSGENLELKET